MIAALNSKKDSAEIAEQVETLALTLKTKVLSFLRTNRSKWESEWVADPNTNTTMEDGEVPTNASEFLAAVARKNRWMCGMCLSSIAMLQKVSVVEWGYTGPDGMSRDQKGWQRIAVLHPGPDYGKYPVLPLVLHGDHYFALRFAPGKKSYPREWANCPEEEELVPSSQDICLSQDINHKLRGGGDLDEDLLRPCSPATASRQATSLLRTYSTRKTSSRKAASLLRTCSTRKTSSPSSAAKPKVIKNITKEKFWVCPFCHDKIQVEENGKRLHNVSNIISRHLQKRHHAVWMQTCKDNLEKGKRGSGLGLRGLCCNIEFINIPEKDWVKQALFVCPYCRLAMPNITESAGILNQKERYMVKRSKLHHLTVCASEQAKGKTIKQCRKDALKKFRYFLNIWPVTEERHQLQEKHCDQAWPRSC